MKKAYILILLSVVTGIEWIYSSHDYIYTNDFISIERDPSIYPNKLPSEQGPLGEPSYVGGYDPNEDEYTPTPGGQVAATPIHGELVLLPMLALYVGYVIFRQKRLRLRRK